MAVESLWALRAKRSIAKCILQNEASHAELLILQDEEIAVRELFADSDVARDRARLLQERLVALGWRVAS